MSLNVNREVQDTFYRYKMPPIIAKVEGKGNGIKTVIVNMSDVAKALGRPPTYPCKFFGCELGAQTQFDVKHDRYIVNGSHDASKLQDMLDIFIKKFILCRECENPETTMVVKHGSIGLVCKACGGQTIVDLRHKLCTYILKNPANQSTNKNTKEKKKDKRNKDKDHSSGDDVSQANGEKHAKTNGVKKEKKEKVSANSELADDDWSVDVSEEAVAERMREITSGAKNLTMNDDLEKTQTERANLLYMLVKARVDDGTILTADKEIAMEAERLDFQNKAPMILVEVLCDSDMRNQVKTYKKHFLRLCHGNIKAQKSLLGGFEKLIALHQDTLLAKTMHVLKELYDNDIIEEEVLIEWGLKPSKKYVSRDLSTLIHEKAKPFITWLREAEEESSEEEDEIDVVYTSKNGQDQVNDAPATAGDDSDHSASEANEEDDLDIDDI